MLGQQGDTIIEVLLAITIFSLVSVGAMTVMNQGTNAAQRALEVTQVRQQIDAQVDMLRAVQQEYTVNPDKSTSTWQTVKAAGGGTTWTDDTKCPSSPADVPGSFALNTRTAKVLGGTDWLKPMNSVNAPSHAKVIYDSGDDGTSYGIWIESSQVTSNPLLTRAYDFTVNACWETVGTGVPARLETIVRLYDPS